VTDTPLITVEETETLTINVSDNSSINESVIVNIPEVGILTVIVSDGITISENILLELENLQIVTQENTSVSDQPSIEIPVGDLSIDIDALDVSNWVRGVKIWAG